MKNCMAYENLTKDAQSAARRLAKKRGTTPEKIAEMSSRIFSERNAVYRARNIV